MIKSTIDNITTHRRMVKNLRFDVSLEWIVQFKDTEKLKLLHKMIENKGPSNKSPITTTYEYINFIERFYNDKQFNSIYCKWIKSGKKHYKRPSIDHIIPKSRGGGNSLSNLQIIPWFENKAKGTMTQVEWLKIKNNIREFMV